MEDNKPTSISEYIASYPFDIQERLQLIRETFQKVVPHATEKISYGIPTIFHKKNLVHFAAYKAHIGIYAMPEANAAFKEELSKYKFDKRSIQLPHNEPIPVALLERLIEFRVIEVG